MYKYNLIAYVNTKSSISAYILHIYTYTYIYLTQVSTYTWMIYIHLCISGK